MTRIFVSLLIVAALLVSPQSSRTPGTSSAAELNSRVLAPVLGAGPWSTFKHDNNRTGRTERRGPQTRAVKWQHYLKGPGIQSPQAIGRDGTIYSGSVQGIFYAFRPDGSIKWKRQLGKYQITAGPAIARDRTIYVPPEFGGLHAFSPNGALKWIFPLEGYAGPSASPATGEDGTIYVGAAKFYAVNPDGTQKWSYDTGGTIAGPPAIGDDGTVYFPSTDYLYAVNPDGTLKWRAPGQAEYPLGSAPAIGKDGIVYVNTNNGVLHAVAHDGTLAWTYPTEGIVMDVPSSPAIGEDGTIYFGGGGEYQGRGGHLYALNPDGGLKWKFFAGCDQTAPSVGGDGTIYFASDYCGTIHALNPDGTVKWTYSNMFVYTRSAPAIGRHRVLYAGLLAGPLDQDLGGLLALGP